MSVLFGTDIRASFRGDNAAAGANYRVEAQRTALRNSVVNAPLEQVWLVSELKVDVPRFVVPVRPDDRHHDTDIPQARLVQRVPIAGRGKRVAACLRGCAKRAHRLLCEQEMIQLPAGREERPHPGAWGLGLLRDNGSRSNKDCRNAADRQ